MLIVCPLCEAIYSGSGKYFTEQSLQQHILDAHKKHNSRKVSLPEQKPESLGLPSGFEGVPDGAYWAIALEW